MGTFLNLADTQVKVGALFRHRLDTLLYMMNWGTGFWITSSSWQGWHKMLHVMLCFQMWWVIRSSILSTNSYWPPYSLCLGADDLCLLTSVVTRVDRVELEIHLPSTFRTHLLLYILSSVNNIHLCRNLAIILLYYITVFKFQLLYWITIQRSESNLAFVVLL